MQLIRKIKDLFLIVVQKCLPTLCATDSDLLDHIADRQRRYFYLAGRGLVVAGIGVPPIFTIFTLLTGWGWILVVGWYLILLITGAVILNTVLLLFCLYHYAEERSVIVHNLVLNLIYIPLIALSLLFSMVLWALCMRWG